MAMEMFWVRWALTALAAVLAAVGCSLTDDWFTRIALAMSVLAVHVVAVDAEARSATKRLSP